MKIHFQKYQGTGNDFIMLNNLDGSYDSLELEQIIRFCDRRFGIGADGLIRINRHENLDFEVDYYNADGSKSFCGNGARCSVAFVNSFGLDKNEVSFNAIDGEHKALIDGDLIRIDMKDVKSIIEKDDSYVLNTGSPHFVHVIDDLNNQDIVQYGREIRYSDEFREKGINVNLMERINDDSIRIATYERGVEDETYSCGTGATACALVFGHLLEHQGFKKVHVQVKGGSLKVEYFRHEDGSFTEVKLSGPAEFVFKGEING